MKPVADDMRRAPLRHGNDLAEGDQDAVVQAGNVLLHDRARVGKQRGVRGFLHLRALAQTGADGLALAAAARLHHDGRAEAGRRRPGLGGPLDRHLPGHRQAVAGKQQVAGDLVRCGAARMQARLGGLGQIQADLPRTLADLGDATAPRQQPPRHAAPSAFPFHRAHLDVGTELVEERPQLVESFGMRLDTRRAGERGGDDADGEFGDCGRQLLRVERDQELPHRLL